MAKRVVTYSEIALPSSIIKDLHIPVPFSFLLCTLCSLQQLSRTILKTAPHPAMTMDLPTWLTVSCTEEEGGGTMLHRSDRLQLLLNSRWPSTINTQPMPPMITFCGASEGNRIVSDIVLLPTEEDQGHMLSPCGRSTTNSIIEVSLHRPAIPRTQQFLLAEVCQSVLSGPTLCASTPTIAAPMPTSTVRSLEIEWTLHKDRRYTTKEIEYQLVGRLLSPFSDVICFFADDKGGLADIASLFSRLSQIIPGSGWPHFPPRAIVFVNCLVREVPVMEQLLSELVTTNPFWRYKVYSCRVSLPTESLLKRILQEATESRVERAKNRMAFNTAQVCFLFNEACTFFSKQISHPFNFIHSARKARPVPVMGPHIAELFSSQTMVEVAAIGIPIVASAVLLDAKVPGMHCKSTKYLFSVRLFSEAHASRSISFCG